MTHTDWLLSGDTGISSKTILAVMTGSEIRASSGVDVPHDPDDFGRCYRLLALFPEWRARLHEVAERHPEWSGLVREWDELTAMYQAEIADGTGKAPRLYKRMQALIDEGAQVRPLRWMCQSCDWAGTDAELLRAANPFDASSLVCGCPKCNAVDDMVNACDENDCDREATCGFPAPGGYRRTCARHYVPAA